MNQIAAVVSSRVFSWRRTPGFARKFRPGKQFAATPRPITKKNEKNENSCWIFFGVERYYY
jgi:hypothetical protein